MLDDLEHGARVPALGTSRSAATALRGKLSPRRDARYGKAYHFTPPESPYLDSMTVQVNITNTDPRAAKNSGGSGAGGSVGSTGN